MGKRDSQIREEQMEVNVEKERVSLKFKELR